MVGGDFYLNLLVGKFKLFRFDFVVVRICVWNLIFERGRVGSMCFFERIEYVRYMVVSFDKGKISSIYDMREELLRILRCKLVVVKFRRVLLVFGL